MADAITTPLTQALAEGKLTREELKTFMRRSDGPAFVHLALWIALLLATGSLVWLASDSWLIWPAMFIHGIVMVHHFSLEHECVHYTVFRTRWLNNLVGNICGVILLIPFKHFRYEHCDHHTYTQLNGDDPELIAMPKTFWEYVLYLTGYPYWKAKLSEVFRNSAGHLSEAEKRFVPKVEYKSVIFEARWMLAFYVAIAVLMIVFGWTAPLWYWIIPVIVSEPVMRFIRMTEHVGRPTVAQMSDNTRTNIVSLPWRFLCWNMNYHAEHHYVASIPYHALPRLHEKLKDHIHVEHGGYLGAHRDILKQLFSGKGPAVDGGAQNAG